MKLKYYLRGLGIGIAVTAIIMSITNKPEEMTDAQIKMRALELGMVEESVLADLQAKEESADVETVEDILNQHAAEKENQEEIPEEEATDVEVENEDIAATEEATTVESEENTAEETTVTESEEAMTEDSTAKEEALEEQPVVEAVTEEEVEETINATEDSKQEDNIKEEVVENYTIIKVEKGNGSEIVSRRLYEAGLVESAVEYNQFLVKNGYDRRLSVGNHEIPSGATHEEMARILCGMK